MSKDDIKFNKALKGILKLRYKIKTKTGLHIGGSKESIEIGGIDNIVIKLPVLRINGNEFRNVPYIPASSLKGKIRALLEWVESPVDNKNQPIAIVKEGNPCDCGKCNICKLFGTHKAQNNTEPVRLRFEEFYPTEETIQMWEDVLEGMYTEMKSENTINRITSRAMPRHLERVIAGSEFEGDITVRIFEGDTYANTVGILKKGLELLEDDYLGGSGSRGYGRIEIECKKVIWKPIDEYKEKEISFGDIENKVFGQ